MTALKLTLKLPDEIARQAVAAGLLKPEAVARLIREALQRRQRVDQLFSAADRLATLDMPPLSEGEVESELQVIRRARRS